MKRKSYKRMNPAKRQELNGLINFWGSKVKKPSMNHASSNANTEDIATTHNTETHARQLSKSEDNPSGGDSE